MSRHSLDAERSDEYFHEQAARRAVASSLTGDTDLNGIDLAATITREEIETLLDTDMSLLPPAGARRPSRNGSRAH